jgi:hypothetical protein
MAERESVGKQLAKGAGRLLVHIIAIVTGLVLMVVGLALGVSLVLLPVGIVVGLVGVLVFLWGFFGRAPAQEEAAPPNQAP